MQSVSLCPSLSRLINQCTHRSQTRCCLWPTKIVSTAATTRNVHPKVTPVTFFNTSDDVLLPPLDPLNPVALLSPNDDPANKRKEKQPMALGYDSHDSRGPSPMFSTRSSFTAPSLLHMPLSSACFPPASFCGISGMNFPRRPSSVPLAITDFLGFYSMPDIASGSIEMNHGVVHCPRLSVCSLLFDR